MSGLSSIFPFRGLGSTNPRDRPPDPVSRLRATLESMPVTRKYAFTPSTRAEILSELYDALWGPYSHLFLPNSNSSLPLHATLADVQARLNFAGAALNDPPVPGRPCGYIFKKGESCFRCKDCALDDSCVLCSRCFHATDHIDHNVSFFIAQQSGGCCDCGDVGAWRVPIACPYHPPGTETPTSLVTFAADHPPTLWGRDIPPVQTHGHRVPVPPELRDSMTRTVAYALDFVLETLDCSPDETSVPTDEADLRLQPSADPMMKDHYCVVLWNDEKHSFSEVIELLCLHTSTSREEASEIANRVDDLGREVIEMSTDVPRVLDVAQKFAQIELGITVRRAYDTFREQVVAVIIEWLLDLTRARLGSDTLVLKEVIAEELLDPRRRSNAMANLPPEVLSIETEISDAVRITWLYLYHTKLWKKPRLSLKEIYAAVLGISHRHKLSVAAHFANVYPRVIDNYLLVDREAETSIKYFALQLFTVPSAALHIVQYYSIVTRILNIITAFFTNQISDRRINYPATAVAEIDVDSEPFKSKRFMPVFSDLRYLCHNEPVQRLIARRHEFITQFAQTCQLFMCINPNKRAANSHVEFETDGWISVFNVTLSLSRVIKVYGEAFQYATPAELVAAITTVTHNILMSVTLSDERLDKMKFNPIVFHDVKFGGSLYSIIQFDVLEGWVSFHHSLQWLLAELFKHVDTLSECSLSEVGLRSIRDILLRSTSEKAVLTIIDFPLRVLAMVAQIRTGLWVRNGFAIRGQLLHYRDFMLRELCYDQDLYILRTALIILDPDLIFVSMMDRFQLLHFFEGGVVHPSYDPQQLLSMVEEFLYVLITILSEGANAGKMPIKDAVRREIVHALAVGPCTFTDLVKRVAERLVEDPCFERVLREVANFRAPEATADSGMYELKPEAYDEINPFFYHYTRNKREEVETVLHNHWKKRGVQDPVIVPRSLGITDGPFAILTAAFDSEVLLQILFYAALNILVLTEVSGTTPSSGEAILDQTLHLAMLVLVERPGVFSHLAATKPFEDGKNFIDMLCVLEHHERYRAYKARCDWILRALAQHVPEAVRVRRRVVLPEAGEGPEDAKKRAARARQEAIMRQMREQQASFVSNIEDDDYEDEDIADADEPASLGTCIVCQEELNTSKPFGALGLIQPSKLVRRQPDGNGGLMNDVMSSPYSLDRSPPASEIPTFPPRGEALHDPKVTTFEVFPPQNIRFGLHASICSHLMHLDCFNAYTLSIRQRHRTQAARNHPESIPRKEYICPLCKSLGNVILPVSHPAPIQLNTLPFADWTRAAGISILKSKSDPLLDSLLINNGTGELVFWGAQDPGYVSFFRAGDRWPDWVMHKMVDSVMNIARAISQQSRHLRDRPEPDAGERGAGLYLPEDLVGYTIACLEIAQRGVGSPGGTVADNVTEPQARMLRGLITCLGKLAVVPFRGRQDEGREALRQAIIKRLLPEWSLSTLNPVSYPLLLRDPFTIVVETAAVAPEMLRHVLILSYYAFLARTVIGLIYVLNKTRSWPVQQPTQRTYENLFGNLRMFFTSVVRHSPVVEHASEIVFTTYGEARIEKLMYCFTLPFLRRAAILVRAVLPGAFPSPALTNAGNERSEYSRLLAMLGIPPLADLPSQDTLQTSLAGWCSHYGHSHAASQLNCGIVLENPTIYRIARLPTMLDTLFGELDRALTCKRCNTLPPDVAICLICGAAVCFQSTHCCIDKEQGDRGECNMHTRDCGGVIGLYFLVKRCCLLYLYAGNGTFALAPYLDIHGEVDTSMRRGRRQFLHPARWEEVRKTWLNHGIPTMVARKLEGTVDSGGWETL